MRGPSDTVTVGQHCDELHGQHHGDGVAATEPSERVLPGADRHATHRDAAVERVAEEDHLLETPPEPQGVTMTAITA